MVMITQAFRYAYEPFVFGKSKDRDNKDTYAKAMKFYVIFTLLTFLTVMGYMASPCSGTQLLGRIRDCSNCNGSRNNVWHLL